MHPYTIGTELGRGAHCVVHAATHRTTGQAVALKRVLPGAIPSAHRRLLREARLQARVRSRHVVSVLAVHGDTSPTVVLQRVNGPTLGQMMRILGPMDWRDACEHIRDVLLALVAAYDQAIVHRDVSPANCLIDRTGRVLLTDFGLAREPADPRITAQGEGMGTSLFTAPEQRLDAHAAGPAADLYATGTLLYALVTGKVVDLSVISGRPAHPAWDRLPQWLRHIVQYACAHRPEDRYPSARHFLRAIEDELGIPLRSLR